MFEPEPRTAFSPGHITGFFQILNDSDPHRKGSVGAGIVLDKGLHVSVTPFCGSGETTVLLNGRVQPTGLSEDSTNAVLTVASEIAAAAEKKYSTPFHFRISERSVLPIGSGFGLSAAGALGTAFAANSSLNLGFSKDQLIEMAHVAEVLNGSGLGDVAGEAAGGLAVREKPGGALCGEFYSVPLPPAEASRKIYCLVLGELSTKDVITNEDCRRKINQAGARSLKNFLQKPSLESFMTESLAFTRSIDLLSPQAEKIIDAIDPADGKAAQAMLGNTVFAVASEREGAAEYLSERMQKAGDVYECRIEKNGPRVCLSAL